MVSTTIVYSMLMIASFATEDACQKWTNDMYSDVFGYACFELDGMYGQFYRVDYPTLKECREASKALSGGKSACGKRFIYGMKPPLSRPDNLLGDKV